MKTENVTFNIDGKKTRDGTRHGEFGQEGRDDRLLPEVSPASCHPDSRLHRVQVKAVQQQVRKGSGTRFNGTFASPILFPFPNIYWGNMWSLARRLAKYSRKTRVNIQNESEYPKTEGAIPSGRRPRGIAPEVFGYSLEFWIFTRVFE